MKETEDIVSETSSPMAANGLSDMDVPKFLTGNLANFLQIIGAIFEISGAYMMANHYLNAPKEQIPKLFINVLRWRDQPGISDIERTVDKLREFSPERTIITIRGLVFISIGFFFQALSSFASIITSAV